MLFGLGLALFFRRPSAETDLPIPVQSDPLVLRKQPDPRTFAVVESSPAASPSQSVAGRPSGAAAIDAYDRQPDRSAGAAAGIAQELSQRRPAGQHADGARRCSEMLPETASAPPTHKIIDGDSLALLAERYLGSASRAMEIYEANRDVLAHPGILPIGAELKIPRADQVSDQSLSRKP